MDLHGCKRSRCLTRGDPNSTDEHQQLMDTESSTHILRSRLLDLPFYTICDILARLPLKNILICRSVCPTLRKVIKDPYFAKIHLATAPTIRTNLILKETQGVTYSSLHFFPFDLGRDTLSSTSSNDDRNNDFFSSFNGIRILNKMNAEYSFRDECFTLVNSCNGLLCLHFTASSSYSVWNPLLSEFVKLPRLTASPPLNNFRNLAGFGYCPRTGEYKVISFRYNSTEMVAFVHTLGSDSWRKVENAPTPIRYSFDPLLNGALHWITNRDIISSFDLESEEFKAIPPPAHFNQKYMNKIWLVNVGVLRDCLCICYIYKDSEFKVWVMREYGVQESWTREFSFELKFYCRLRVEDLSRPVRFLRNGDMLFIFSSGILVSFSPAKGTFRELRTMGKRNSDVTVHDLSFISLKDVMGEKRTEVTRLCITRPKCTMQDYFSMASTFR